MALDRDLNRSTWWWAAEDGYGLFGMHYTALCILELGGRVVRHLVPRNPCPPIVS